MSGAYRFIRQNRTGELDVGLATGHDGNLVYLMAGPVEVLAVLERFPFVPRAAGMADVGGMSYWVYEVPQGTPLETLLPAITEEQAVDAMRVLTVALSLLVRLGCTLAEDGMAERLLVLDHSEEWRFDFAAACLGARSDGATLPSSLAAIFTRVLALPQLKGSRPLGSLERKVREFPYRTPEEWMAEFAAGAPEVGPPAAASTTGRQSRRGWVVAVVLLGAVGSSWYWWNQESADRAAARPEPVVAPVPPATEKPAPVQTAPGEPVVKQTEPESATVTAPPEVDVGLPTDDLQDYLKPKRSLASKPAEEASAKPGEQGRASQASVRIPTTPPPPMPAVATGSVESLDAAVDGTRAAAVSFNGAWAGHAFVYVGQGGVAMSLDAYNARTNHHLRWTHRADGKLLLWNYNRQLVTTDFRMTDKRPWLVLTPGLQAQLGIRATSSPDAVHISER